MDHWTVLSPDGRVLAVEEGQRRSKRGKDYVRGRSGCVEPAHRPGGEFTLVIEVKPEQAFGPYLASISSRLPDLPVGSSSRPPSSVAGSAGFGADSACSAPSWGAGAGTVHRSAASATRRSKASAQALPRRACVRAAGTCGGKTGREVRHRSVRGYGRLRSNTCAGVDC